MTRWFHPTLVATSTIDLFRTVPCYVPEDEAFDALSSCLESQERFDLLRASGWDEFAALAAESDVVVVQYRDNDSTQARRLRRFQLGGARRIHTVVLSWRLRAASLRDLDVPGDRLISLPADEKVVPSILTRVSLLARKRELRRGIAGGRVVPRELRGMLYQVLRLDLDDLVDGWLAVLARERNEFEGVSWKSCQLFSVKVPRVGRSRFSFFAFSHSLG